LKFYVQFPISCNETKVPGKRKDFILKPNKHYVIIEVAYKVVEVYISCVL